VLVSASRRNRLSNASWRAVFSQPIKVRDRENALASTRDARAPQTCAVAPYLLRAFFERGGFAVQVRKDFTGEVE
jgi:hypothetical protein